MFLASCLSCWTDLGESWDNLGWGRGGGKRKGRKGRRKVKGEERTRE